MHPLSEQPSRNASVNVRVSASLKDMRGSTASFFDVKIGDEDCHKGEWYVHSDQRRAAVLPCCPSPSKSGRGLQGCRSDVEGALQDGVHEF